MRVSNTCYARIIHALRAYQTHVTHVSHMRHARIEKYATLVSLSRHVRIADMLRTYHTRVMRLTVAHNITRHVRIERMLRSNHIRAEIVSSTCYARITHARRAYRKHVTHVSHMRHARIEHMLCTYHSIAPCAYRTRATHVSL